MLEPVTRRQRAEISEWQQSAGSARADNGAVYTLSFDNYRPDATNFALPAKGMAVELWLQCDGSGAVESITFSPVPRTKAFWRFRSPRDLAQVPGRRFECQRRRMAKYWFESLLVGVGVMFLMDGIWRLFGSRIPYSAWIGGLMGSIINFWDRLLSKSLPWAWTDTEFYCLSSQSGDGWPYFALWRTLRSVRIRRTWVFRRPYAQLKFDGGSKDTRAVLRLPLHLLADSDRAETLSILRRRAQSCGADWQE